ncbi:aspartate aminotransferase family protein [Aeromicrobium phragmitis]|uniref:Aspartate aminotransferase family protein n=2 Tax=Aeromicrobium phragmitis TaxID=2478914 RepID=A0A3L8PM84_9ACTN|nr:aspartate aminotransferase family protein [Aeromicrobium phragmitis]
MLRSADLPTHGGRTLAYVYDSGLAEADEIGRHALAMYSSANGLDPTAFPSLLTMENELVGFARELVGVPGAVGSVTSGGTESILLAVQAARDARKVDRPVMVLPSTIHAAFHKAAHYFGVEAVVVDVDRATKKADVDATRAALEEFGDRVVLLAASAPSYAHGVIDPIEAFGALAAERGLRFHVDACIGGWVLPFSPTAPPWDLRVEGVTSLSVDLHKYAYTPKGASLLLHRTPELRRPQFFAYADWPGYTMLNATTQSTKSGGPLAAAWAVVQHIGREGYATLARAALGATNRLAEGIAAMEHLALAADPESTLLSFGVDETLDVFTLSDEMLARGWFVQPQMRFGELPATVHLTVSAATASSVPQFLDDLAAAVNSAVAAGPVVVAPELVAAAQATDPAELDDAAFDGLLELAGLGGGGAVALPERMAPVNALLDVAPPRLREALLVAFLDRLTR